MNFVSNANVNHWQLLKFCFSAIGINMIYFSSKYSMVTTKDSPHLSLKILIPISLCALLLGCDSHSSSPSTSIDKSMLAATNSENSTNKNPEKAIEDQNLESVEAKGESLIMAAKSDKKSSSSHSLSDSSSTPTSQMQATLIGDYVGVMPCSFCDSTQVLLNLFSDGLAVKTSVYNNPKQPRAALTENGIYRQDNDTITIVYDDQRIESYLIQNNHLVFLDDNKVADSDYTLSPL